MRGAGDLPSLVKGAAMTTRTATAGLELAVRLALSRFVGSQGGRRAYAWYLCVAVAAIGQLEEKTGGGGWPDGRIALREIGLSARQLDEKWVIAQANGNLLEEAILRSFVPIKLWPSLAQVIEDGPVVAWAKLEQVLRCWSRGVEIDGSPRAGGAWSAGTVAMCVNAFHRLMRELTEVRKLALTSELGISPELLKRQWGPENIPRRLSSAHLGAAPGNGDRSAPSLRSARLALRAAHRRVESRQEVAGQAAASGADGDRGDAGRDADFDLPVTLGLGVEWHLVVFARVFHLRTVGPGADVATSGARLVAIFGQCG